MAATFTNHIEFAVQNDDVLRVDADMLILKHAQSFYGVDQVVANMLEMEGITSLSEIAETLTQEDHLHIPQTSSLQAKTVLFVKTPSLSTFHYPDLRQFGIDAIKLTSKYSGNASHIATTLHGPGFGLDFAASFLAQIGGLLDGLAGLSIPTALKGISLVERNPEKSALMALLLKQRFMGEPYIRPSPTGVSQMIDINQLQAIRSNQDS
ncbi:MAG: hypothetical protein AAF702_09700 [Chloroflexota bacterium]